MAMTSNVPVLLRPHANFLDDSEAGWHSADLPDDIPPEVSNMLVPTQSGEYAIAMDHHFGKTWYALRITSRSRHSKRLPMYVEGDPITGTAELALQRPDHIRGILIIVKGILRYTAYESKTFVEVSQTIWPNSATDHYSSTRTADQSGDLPPGHYSWPFLLSLPSRIQVSEKEANDLGLAVNERLPPSLNEKELHAGIEYQILLQIKRSGLFHHNIKLATPFDYVPATRPDPPSRHRALAYEENSPILGPDKDPEGWKVFPIVHLDGRLFKTVYACLCVSLALPTPLAYPLGTAFPCALILSSSNKQAIDLLSTSNALIVEIHRKLQTAVGESIMGGALTFSEPDRVPLTKANWHPAEVHETNGVYICTVLGELSLPQNLVPSFSLGKFECRYVVDVYPPKVAGFEPASYERLFRTDVAVTSLLGPGPRPRADLQPGYLAPAQSASNKKNTFSLQRIGSDIFV